MPCDYCGSNLHDTKSGRNYHKGVPNPRGQRSKIISGLKKASVAKKMSRASALQYMLGKSDAEWAGSASRAAIIGKDGKVKRNIDR